MEGTCGHLTCSPAHGDRHSPATAGDGHPVRGGGNCPEQGSSPSLGGSSPASSDPEGGLEGPLHQLVWSEALLRGELQAENLSFPGPLFVAGSLHCSCGVWLVKQTPLSAVRLRHGCCWVASSISRSCGGVCVCTRAPVKGCFLSPKLDRLSRQPRGQPQQQPGLTAESPKEEGHQVLHRSFVWQEGEGPAWTPRQGGARTRWVPHHSEGGGSACMSLLCLSHCPHEAPVTPTGCPPGRSRGGVCLL